MYANSLKYMFVIFIYWERKGNYNWFGNKRFPVQNAYTDTIHNECHVTNNPHECFNCYRYFKHGSSQSWLCWNSCTRYYNDMHGTFVRRLHQRQSGQVVWTSPRGDTKSSWIRELLNGNRFV